MPPVKTPRKPKDDDSSAAALVIFAQNLEEIRRWYRGATYPGHEVGHVVLQEMVIDKVSTALVLALQGKRWEAPLNSQP